MLRRALGVVALSAIAFASPAAAQAPGAMPGLDTAAILASARADIDAANDGWVPSLRRKNAMGIAYAYADSGLFIAHDGTVTRGRAAVARMYESTFPRMRQIVDGGIVQEGMAVERPDRIYEWGRAWLVMAPAKDGDPPTRTGGAYLTVWERQADGHWRITRNMVP